MAQMVATFRKILYFCSVKLKVRYIAAAMSSVFCANEFIKNIERNEWVSSNAPKALALLSLTTRSRFFYCQN
jgi:hypothetical protein